MYKLKTPLTIGDIIYDCLFPVKGAWDFRNGKLTIQLAPAREEDGHIRLATIEGSEILAPIPVATMEINLNDEDAGSLTAFLGLQTGLEVAEVGMVGKFTGQTYVIGETRYPLDVEHCTTTKLGRSIQN